jgi:hypothetical protein
MQQAARMFGHSSSLMGLLGLSSSCRVLLGNSAYQLIGIPNPLQLLPLTRQHLSQVPTQVGQNPSIPRNLLLLLLSAEYVLTNPSHDHKGRGGGGGRGGRGGGRGGGGRGGGRGGGGRGGRGSGGRGRGGRGRGGRGRQ